jgi:hypothetical protein
MKTCVVRKRLPPYSGAAGNVTDTVYTPPGFGTPKFAICYYTNGSDNDTFDESTTNRIIGFGFIGLSAADNSTLLSYTSFCAFLHNEPYNSPNNKSVSGASSTRFVYEVTASRNVIRQCFNASFGQDKLDFTYQNTTTSTNSLDLVFIFFTGSDIQANVGSLALNATLNQTASVTGLTFAPDLIFTMGSGFALDSNQTDGRISLGCATRFGSIKNSSSSFRMRNSAGTATTVSEYVADNRCYLMFNSNANTINTAEVTSFNSDGFTVTSRTSFLGTTNQMLYMAIKGPSSNIFDLQNFSSATSTGISGIATTNFIPSLVLGALGTVTTTNTLTTSNDSTGISFFAAKSLTAKSNYGAGSMSVTSGLTAVTGAGTAFSSLNPGDVIYNSVNTFIGTISSTLSNTSLTLASGAAATMSSEKYSIIPFGQFSVSIGASGAATTTKIYSAINTNPFFVASYGTSGSATTLIKAKVNNFDSYPGFKINYDTVDATARKGWFIAFKDNENRRRDGN